MSKPLSGHFSIKVNRENKTVKFVIHDQPDGHTYFAEISDPDGSICERMRAAFAKELCAQPNYNCGREK